ncbi:MAG: RNA-binding S4 domain-containing protein, partial [Thermaerobacterales bacterium]
GSVVLRLACHLPGRNIGMRVDRFLKVSRLVKRRTVARALCDAGAVSVNDRTAKAGTQLAVGDTLAVRFGEREIRVRVAVLRDSVKAAEAESLYEPL